MKDKPPYTAPLGFASIHIARDINGAVHARPSISKPRLLLTIPIISGNCADIVEKTKDKPSQP